MNRAAMNILVHVSFGEGLSVSLLCIDLILGHMVRFLTLEIASSPACLHILHSYQPHMRVPSGCCP